MDFTESHEPSDRIPPQSIEAEMSVLGSMFLDREATGKAIEILDESAFYKDIHRIIYLAAISLYEKSEPVDIITLTEELTRQKQLEQIGGSYYLTELAESVPSAANVEYHAKIVLEKSLLRKLINVGNNISLEGYSPEKEVFDIIDKAEQAIFSLAEKRLQKGFLDINPIMHETFEQIEKLHSKEGGISGVASGFKKLDEMTAGFHNSEFIVIAGRPSMGKTALALNIARNAALDNDVCIGILSLEMANYQLGMRLLCSEARVNAHSLRTGKLSKNDWPKLSEAVGKLSASKIFIDDSPNLGILEIRAKARRLKVEKNLGLLIIDYLQLVQGPSSEGRQQEISAISRSLKALAKELDIPVIALSQLSRAVEQRGGDKRPVLSDLRESGAIEQDADLVLFIYRPEVYKDIYDDEGNSLEGIAEIIIGKQRNGPIGTVKLAFIEDYSKFENLDTYHDFDMTG
ncbi:replicative DNA helicase [candidate division KSB1 bacterium]|nr:replicative DNA helicase [candidate division KSB1 bacterium]